MQNQTTYIPDPEELFSTLNEMFIPSPEVRSTEAFISVLETSQEGEDILTQAKRIRDFILKLLKEFWRWVKKVFKALIKFIGLNKETHEQDLTILKETLPNLTKEDKEEVVELSVNEIVKNPAKTGGIIVNKLRLSGANGTPDEIGKTMTFLRELVEIIATSDDPFEEIYKHGNDEMTNHALDLYLNRSYAGNYPVDLVDQVEKATERVGFVSGRMVVIFYINELRMTQVAVKTLEFSEFDVEELKEGMQEIINTFEDTSKELEMVDQFVIGEHLSELEYMTKLIEKSAKDMDRFRANNKVIQANILHRTMIKALNALGADLVKEAVHVKRFVSTLAKVSVYKYPSPSGIVTIINTAKTANGRGYKARMRTLCRKMKLPLSLEEILVSISRVPRMTPIAFLTKQNRFKAVCVEAGTGKLKLVTDLEHNYVDFDMYMPIFVFDHSSNEWVAFTMAPSVKDIERHINKL